MYRLNAFAVGRAAGTAFPCLRIGLGVSYIERSVTRRLGQVTTRLILHNIAVDEP